MPIQGASYYFSAQQQGIDRRAKALLIERCATFLRGPRVLDLGYVDGDWSDLVLSRGWRSDIVEGHPEHVRRARDRYAGRDVRVIEALFDSFTPDQSYDSIIAGDVLRYLDDPIDFLRRLGHSLNPEGRLIVTIPNSRSLHRRIGTLMHIESHPSQSNSRDIEVGNKRQYDRYELRAHLSEAALSIVELRGFFLKPLSSSQMVDWSDEMLRAFSEIGDELEDYAWFIYAVCKRA